MRWIFLLTFLCSCYRPQHQAEEPPPEYSLTVFVAAQRLNYTNFYTLCRSMQCSKSGNVGHAWIHLHGRKEGCTVDLIGGLSGELEVIKPAYCNGVMDYVEAGDENPVRYLWCSLNDGFFQEGSGGHRPTYAVRFRLNSSQFEEVFQFVQGFDYRSYALTGWQCASFVSKVAELAGHPLEVTVTVPICQTMHFRGRKMTLWRDRQYDQITFPSPDRLEQSLKERVARGEGQLLPTS